MRGFTDEERKLLATVRVFAKQRLAKGENRFGAALNKAVYVIDHVETLIDQIGKTDRQMQNIRAQIEKIKEMDAAHLRATAVCH